MLWDLRHVKQTGEEICEKKSGSILKVGRIVWKLRLVNCLS